jgi:Chitobiase/beta-hexosaminidase C-terminal domain
VPPDFAVPRDFAAPRDFAMPSDFATPRDFAMPPDFAVPPDFAPPPDMAKPPPHVTSSPGPAPALYNNAWAVPFTLTLAADDPAASVYYTTDGSTPTLASPHAVTPVTLSISAATTTVRYFGQGTGAASAITTEAFGVSAAQQTGAGYLVTLTRVASNSPIVVATPGQTFTMAVANWMVWVQSLCPGCAAQLVYGVDMTDQGCFYDGSPGVYPGMSATGATFTITAPVTPGLHEVRVGHIEQTNCAAAMAAGTLATRPNISRIALLVVP